MDESKKAKILKPTPGRTDVRHEIGMKTGFVVMGYREVSVSPDDHGNLVLGGGRPASTATLAFWKLLGGPQ